MPETVDKAKKNLAVWVIIGLVIAIRIASIFTIPFGQKVEHHLEGLNDEPAHFNYVKYLAEHQAFPVLEHWVLEKDAFVRNEFEYHQAPLYYLLCVPLYKIAGQKHAVTACRLLSVLVGIMTLWVIALLLRDLGYGRRIKLAAVLFVGLLPSHLYFTSLVSNDGLSWLIALLLTRQLLLYGFSAATGPRHAPFVPCLPMACLLAAGALTKSSLLIFFPVAAVVFVYKFWMTRDRSALVYGSAVLAVSVIAALPWYARNLMLYHSLLGSPEPAAVSSLSASTVIGLVKGSIKYFWFPMQHLEGGTPAFLALGLIGSAIVGFHLALAVVWFFKKGNAGYTSIILLSLLLVNAAAYVWYYMQWQNPEARFLFPALAAIAFFMLVPAFEAFRKIKAEYLFIPYLSAISLFPYVFLFFSK